MSYATEHNSFTSRYLLILYNKCVKKIKVLDLTELCVSGEVHAFEALFDHKLLTRLSPWARIWGGGELGI
jgi:hypothetical protein